MTRDMTDDNVRDFAAEQPIGKTVTDLGDGDMVMFENLVRELVLLREQKATLASREKELRDAIPPYLDVIGEPSGPSGQHLSFTLDLPVRGVVRVVWQSKVSRTVDEEVAETIARSKNIYDHLFVMRPVLSEEAVLAAMDDGLITDEELDRIFPSKITRALVLEKEKRK